MTFPNKAIDRLFERLEATYGDDWARKWKGVPMTDVKTAWAHELGIFGNRLDAVAWALENLPEQCPNVIQFKNLCRQAPAKEVPMLPQSKADPERLKVELSKLSELRIKSADAVKVDHRAWAKRILQDVKDGMRRNPTAVQMAKNALRAE
jgi:hypothetical protein